MNRASSRGDNAPGTPRAANAPTQPGHRTIQKGGLVANFCDYVERSTGARALPRFLWQGTVLTLLYRLPGIGACIMRSIVYRTVLGGIGSSCLLEADVRLHVPKRIFLGHRVFVGQYSYLDGQTSFVRLGNDVHVARFCTLRAGERGITIHDGAGINTRAYIDGNGEVEIGRNALLSPGVQVISGNHVFDRVDVPIRDQGTAYGKVTIGEDCWLGTNAIVLPGVTVGRGSVVGAGAVVTHNLPDLSIALGVPARIVGRRGAAGKKVDFV
jgi:acetyltransferase-like isoleucine patch superfamily enzyme